MKKILILILMIPVIMNNACSQDVTYKDAYGYTGKKIVQDNQTASSVIDGLSDEAASESRIKEKALVKEIITKEMPSGFSTGMQWKKAGKYASSFFSQWLDSWRSMNVEYFLSHYSSDFNNGERDFDEWAKVKRKLSLSKTYIRVNATSVSLLKHPKKNIMVTTFFQDYRSNNFSDQSWKRQYWVKESDERWRILHESEIEGPYTPFLKRFNN